MKAILIVWLVIFVAGCYGWIMNLIAVIHSPAVVEWGGMEVLRAIGILAAPLGAILGYF